MTRWTSKSDFDTAICILVSVDLVQAGVVLSQSLQRAIVRTGTTVIDDRLVKTLKSFRLLVLKESPDLIFYLHPLTLTKLALFMVTTMRESGRSNLPFVIAALDVNSDTYLIAGLDNERTGNLKQK
jgi:cell division control protein 45